PQAMAGAEDRQRSAATAAQDLERRIAELNRNAETNNLASESDLNSQKQAQQNLNKVGQQAMPQAANKIADAQMQGRQNPQAAKPQLGQASQQQQQILDDLKNIENQLKPGSELERLASRFERLAAEQRSMQKATEKMLPDTVGKAMSELTEA